jgi:heme-degrading monooxygenase HmoA
MMPPGAAIRRFDPATIQQAHLEARYRRPVTRRHQIAQVNIGRPLEPVTSALLADFVENLEPINRLADGAPGFVWRLQTEAGDATSIHAFDDDSLLINMSVWDSLEALRAFVYSSDHAGVMRRRREWFERLVRPIVALWWVPAGHRPGVAEAVERLSLLERLGPTPDAFTFRQTFPEPAAESTARALSEA